MAANRANIELLVFVVLFAATFLSCSAVDLASAQGFTGRKTLLESTEKMVTHDIVSGESTAQQVKLRSVNITPGAFSTKPRNTPAPSAVGPAPSLFNLKPRNTPAPPAVGPAPGLFNLKLLNTPAPPAVGPAPGLFNLKPRNTPAPPAVGPAPGHFNLKPRNTPIPPHGPAPGKRLVNKGFNQEGATLIPGGF